jgi:hypothetical protein
LPPNTHDSVVPPARPTAAHATQEHTSRLSIVCLCWTTRSATMGSSKTCSQAHAKSTVCGRHRRAATCRSRGLLCPFEYKTLRTVRLLNCCLTHDTAPRSTGAEQHCSSKEAHNETEPSALPRLSTIAHEGFFDRSKILHCMFAFSTKPNAAASAAVDCRYWQEAAAVYCRPE